MTSHVLAPAQAKSWAIGDTLLVFAAWALVVALLVLQHVPELIASGPTDPDSQMRLVEVRDFLAGQPWSDLHQLRLNPPDGVLMHWSRLIDWPIAALIRASQPWLGYDTAEVFAITAWPLLLYLLFLFAIAAVARRLIGHTGVFPALAFAICAAPATGMFVPGHITHHNAQIALFALLLAFVVRIERSEVAGVLAGVTAAVMLSIGLETLPLVGMIAGGLALVWAFAPKSSRLGVNAFALFFGTGMVVQRGFMAAPADWLTAPCDIASAPYVGAAFVGGMGLACLIRLNPTSLAIRFAGLGIIALATAIVFWQINPHCVAGPYAEIDPRIIQLWLDHVEEAHNFGEIAAGAPWLLIGLYLAPFLSLMPTSWAFATALRSERVGWGIALALLMTALAVAMWEERGSTFASVLAVPGFAYAVVEVRRKCSGRGPIVLAGCLILIYCVPNQALETLAADALRERFAGRGGSLASGGLSLPAGRAATSFAQCAARGNFAGLAIQPKGLVLTESNLGPSVLLDTPHSTLAAPYHRNTGGLIDGLGALRAPLAGAYAIIQSRHVAYVATCPSDPEVALIREGAPNGLLTRLLSNDVPDWLQPVAIQGPLKVWRVIDPTLAGRADTTMTGAAVPRRQLQPGVLDLRGSIIPMQRMP